VSTSAHKRLFRATDVVMQVKMNINNNKKDKKSEVKSRLFSYNNK